jgi:hypothetical protein
MLIVEILSISVIFGQSAHERTYTADPYESCINNNSNNNNNNYYYYYNWNGVGWNHLLQVTKKLQQAVNMLMRLWIP